MNIVMDNKKFKKAHIAGPGHNFLSLSLTRNRLSFNFVLTDLNIDENNINLSEEQVRKQIMQGLDLINHELGEDYKITSAEFLGNDTNSEAYMQSLHLIS